MPFSNEIEMQEFIETYAKQTLNLKVIASTRPGRQGLYKIDVLAVDSANTPYIIECKWNEVRPSAIRQLLRYRELLTADAGEEFGGQCGYDEQYGARPLKRSIQRLLENPLAVRLLCRGDQLLAGKGDLRAEREQEDRITYLVRNSQRCRHRPGGR